MSFTENRESNFYARELKTIHLVAENCVGLKLEFDEAYVNEKNEHKQIGIAKIQIIGMTLEQKMPTQQRQQQSFYSGRENAGGENCEFKRTLDASVVLVYHHDAKKQRDDEYHVHVAADV